MDKKIKCNRKPHSRTLNCRCGKNLTVSYYPIHYRYKCKYWKHIYEDDEDYYDVKLRLFISDDNFYLF